MISRSLRRPLADPPHGEPAALSHQHLLNFGVQIRVSLAGTRTLPEHSVRLKAGSRESSCACWRVHGGAAAWPLAPVRKSLGGFIASVSCIPVHAMRRIIAASNT